MFEYRIDIKFINDKSKVYTIVSVVYNAIGNKVREYMVR